MLRLAAALAAAVSAALLVTVLLRDIGLNPLNVWTIVLGLLASGLLAVPGTRGHLLAPWIILVLAMVPALIGGLGILYLPSLVMITLVAALRVGSGSAGAVTH